MASLSLGSSDAEKTKHAAVTARSPGTLFKPAPAAPVQRCRKPQRLFSVNQGLRKLPPPFKHFNCIVHLARRAAVGDGPC